MSFDDFWGTREAPNYPHRPKCRPKKSALAYWHGHKPLADGSRITPEDWPAIIEGARAARILWGDDPYRINAARFLFTGAWEGAIEELAEQNAPARESDRDAYHAWKREEQARGGIGSREDYERHLWRERVNAERRPNLKVVG